MTADQLLAEAAENRPPTPPPSLDNVERGLRQLLESMLATFNYDAQFDSGAAQACRVHALLIAEVQALRRVQAHQSHRHGQRNGASSTQEGRH